MMTLRLEFVPKKICMSAGLGSDLKPRFFAAIFRWLVSYSTS